MPCLSRNAQAAPLVHAHAREERCAAARSAVQAAEAAMAAMLKLPDIGRSATKQQSRQDFVDAWRKYIPVEAEVGFTQLERPATVAALRAVLDRLGGGKQRSRL